jgi:hypothetical protein
MYYIYRRNVFNFGHNDGDEITDELTLILDYTSKSDTAINLKENWQFEFYKQVWKYKVVTNQEKQKILIILGKEANEYNWEKLLADISFDTYKKLEAELKFDFLKIIECEAKKNKFYPLIKHSKFKEFDLDTKDYHDLEHLTYRLSSDSKREAFEKGVLFLLLTNDISLFIGDPETTEYEADFLDCYYNSRKKMLDYFTQRNVFFVKRSVSKSLISKHNILKFWILENPYRIDKDKFDNFLQFKNEILKDKIEHFDKIVDLFMQRQEDLIEIINVC